MSHLLQQIMSESEWLKNDDFYIMLKHISGNCDESSHRTIGCKFARLVWDDLPEIGRMALARAEELHCLQMAFLE